ncbi:MAG: GNAT family N-acetyltransferase [Promethearchaeota archaeon]|nr:MAG: GNAT family N-acetyltransferase [Candidatus Lokiarchaeota archaeon]
MKIGILYNYVDSISRGVDRDKIAENESTAVVDYIYAALCPYHDVMPVRITPLTLKDIADAKFDIAFNICEGIGGNVSGEAYVPAILDTFQVPYTGSNHFTLSLCLHKARTKQILQAGGILTPAFQVFNTDNEPLKETLTYPLIVKPLSEDASIGITVDSVVHDDTHLYHQITHILNTYKQPVLVEEYIDGREINIAIFGNGSDVFALPPSEILFDLVPGTPRIVDYESKWISDSYMFSHTEGICPADLNPDLSKILNRVAIDSYKLTGCQDYARVDFRLQGDTPYVLEVNPNPGINIDSGYVRSAECYGWSYETLIHEILYAALKRYNLYLPNPMPKLPPIIPFYHSQRLDFYPIIYPDLDVLYSWFNNQYISRYMVDPESYTSMDQLIVDFLLHPTNSSTSGVALMAYERNSNEPIGYGAIYDVTTWNQNAEISFLIGNSKFAGKGYGTEIVQTLVDIATNKFNLFRVEAAATELNYASWKILEKVGFRRIGYRSQSHVFKGNRYNDFLYEYVPSLP